MFNRIVKAGPGMKKMSAGKKGPMAKQSMSVSRPAIAKHSRHKPLPIRHPLKGK